MARSAALGQPGSVQQTPVARGRPSGGAPNEAGPEARPYQDGPEARRLGRADACRRGPRVGLFADREVGSVGGTAVPCCVAPAAELRGWDPPTPRAPWEWRYVARDIGRPLALSVAGCHCGSAVQQYEESVGVWRGPPGVHRSAHFAGLQSCGQLWTCPVCAATIAGRRRRAIADLIRVAALRGRWLAMVALTVPHQRMHRLRSVQRVVMAAIRSVTGHADWRRWRAHVIRSQDITHGEHGWHAHLHLVVSLPGHLSSRAVGDWVACLRRLWLRAVVRQGWESPDEEHGVHVDRIRTRGWRAITEDDVQAISSYVTSGNAASEVALTSAAGKRQHKQGGRDVVGILVDIGQRLEALGLLRRFLRRGPGRGEGGPGLRTYGWLRREVRQLEGGRRRDGEQLLRDVRLYVEWQRDTRGSRQIAESRDWITAYAEHEGVERDRVRSLDRIAEYLEQRSTSHEDGASGDSEPAAGGLRQIDRGELVCRLRREVWAAMRHVPLLRYRVLHEVARDGVHGVDVALRPYRSLWGWADPMVTTAAEQAEERMEREVVAAEERGVPPALGAWSGGGQLCLTEWGQGP